jgi:hypothetical protein
LGVLEKLNLQDGATDSSAIDFGELCRRLSQPVSPAFLEPYHPLDAEVAAMLAHVRPDLIQKVAENYLETQVKNGEVQFGTTKLVPSLVPAAKSKVKQLEPNKCAKSLWPTRK